MNQIVRLETCNGYTCVYLQNKEVYTESGHIGLFEEKLAPSRLFIRVHRAHIINYKQIQSYNPRGLVLHDGTPLPVSMPGFLALDTFFAAL